MTELPPRSTLASQVAEIVRRHIGRGQAGEFLPGERALGKRFQVSRITVRSALEVFRRETLLRQP